MVNRDSDEFRCVPDESIVLRRLVAQAWVVLARHVPDNESVVNDKENSDAEPTD